MSKSGMQNRCGLREKLRAGKDYYEIRLESIGGLGANLCGKMLGELGLKYLDLNSSNFASYGSEKAGTPVKGFIRYCRKEKEIRIHYPVVEPDLLIFFHPALLMDENGFKGCSAETAVIVAMGNGQQTGEITNRPGIHYGIEAQKIAIETRSRINVVMLGAALRVMGIDDLSVGEKICADTLGKKYPDALKINLEGMKRGYREIKLLDKGEKTKQKEKDKEENTEGTKGKKTVWGYANAPIGGINPLSGNSVVSDLSPSRQGYIPVFIKEKCINCGLCHSTCPDMVFQFQKGEYKGREMMVNQGLDYAYCKGCFRCVDICPTKALLKGGEV